MVQTSTIPLTVNDHHNIPCYWHVCYSEEYINRLVHVANCSQVFLATASITHMLLEDFTIWKDVAITQILALILHEFILWFSLSLAGFLVSRMAVLLCFFSSWYSWLGLIKQHRLLCSHLLSATWTVECPRAAGRQAPWHTYNCTEPLHCWCKFQHCTSDFPARKTCHSSGLTQGTDRVARNC